MYNPKEEVYSLLSTLGYSLYQYLSNEFYSLPVITYTISNDSVDVIDMDNNMLSQYVVATIDIWTSTSTDGSRILDEIEQLLRGNNYILIWSSDVPNTDTIYHTQSRFKKIFV